MKLYRTIVLTLVVTVAAAGQAVAATVTVCRSGCAFTEIAPAITAARAGDTIRVLAGTYKGGLTIDKDLSLVGDGAGMTVIEGGGPVITIGAWLARSEPTVKLSGVTVTHGLTTVGPEGSRNIAFGGGIFIPPSADLRTGATVVISHSAITDNTASPSSSQLVGPPCPGGKPCPFAGAWGGGIANGGRLTLTSSTVADNRAVGPTASDSDGGGIWNTGGSLTLRHSLVTRNVASASAPNGRFAEGGGIFTEVGETVEITDSAITANTASLTSSFPFCMCGGQPFQMAANSGGIHMGDKGSLTIARTRIDHNTVTVFDLNGEPQAIDSGLCQCGNSTALHLIDSSVSHNRLIAHVRSAEDVFACCDGESGGALEFDGPATIRDAHVSDNSTTVTSTTGSAVAGGTVFSGSSNVRSLLTDSIISGNRVTALSDSGSAKVLGAGVLNTALLELSNDQIRGNTATATGRTGFAQGAGIWNAQLPGAPPVSLWVEHTTVTHNALFGSATIGLQGGGLYTAAPIMLSHNRITANTPDNCFGAGC